MLFSKNSEKIFNFEGLYKADKNPVKGEINAANEKEARNKLTRRGIFVKSLVQTKQGRAKAIKSQDVTVFSRQLATMMKSGLPLLQAFDIVAKGHSNPSMTKLLLDIKGNIEQGESLSASFAKHPKYFDKLFCNLVAAGETGGVLESLLDKLATYKEKTESIKKKVKGALMYPAVVVIVAIALIICMMMFVLPAFKGIYEGMGATLPWITEKLMAGSDFFVAHGIWVIAGIIVFAVGITQYYKRSFAFQKRFDALLLKLPIFGDIVLKSVVARWGRTTATLFHAGIPLVEALDSVAGASGNIIYEEATQKIKAQVNQGTSLTTSMRETQLFPNMFLQMAMIGEESGSLDDMLDKASAYYEEEVDNAVANISSLMEPIIMVVLGGIVGVILVAMYLPLFGLGNAIG